MTPTTETLDKLYLEWSQFTGARNGRERLYAEGLALLLQLAKKNIEEAAASVQAHPTTSEARAVALAWLKSADRVAILLGDIEAEVARFQVVGR